MLLTVPTPANTPASLAAQLATKADKIVPSAANNIALLTSTGDLADSGVQTSTLATTASATALAATAQSNAEGYTNSLLTSYVTTSSLTSTLLNYATVSSLTSYVTNSSLTTTLANYAPLASPTFTGGITLSSGNLTFSNSGSTLAVSIISPTASPYGTTIKGGNNNAVGNTALTLTGAVNTNASSGTATTVAITPTFSTTGTAGWIALNVNATQSSDTGTGVKYLQTWQLGGSNVAEMTTYGALYLTNGAYAPNFTNPLGSLTIQSTNFNTAANYVQMAAGTYNPTSGQVNCVAITPTYNETSGTASNTDLYINRTETAIGSGNQYLINAAVGGTSKFSVDHGGNFHITGNVQTNTVTTSNSSLTLQQTGDTYGTTSLSLQNRTGLNGALFTNATLDLVEVGFLPSSGTQSNIRLEHRSGDLYSSSNTTGEFQFYMNVTGTPTTALAVGQYVTSIVSPLAVVGKVGFFNTTPQSQQTGGAATAGSSYTSNEQSMLQKVYNALRTYGLLS